MARLAIKGHKSRGNEVIEILEMLGGKNLHNYCADCDSSCFYIGKETNIIYYDYVNNCEDLLIFTLEEFEQKFPYKVGDKIIYKIYGIHSKIKTMLWNVEKEQVFYRLESNKLFVATADELKPYKEETMEEIKVDIPKGYEFAGVDDTTQQVMFTKIQPEYPKTFDECSVVLSELPHTTLISSFYKLLVCRDAYWQIADWKFNYDEKCYYLCPELGEIQKYEGVCDCNAVLAFPTKEVRDMFLENFRELINQCKELL